MNDIPIAYDTVKMNNFSENFEQTNFTKYSPKQAIDQYNAIKSFLLKNAIKESKIDDQKDSKTSLSLKDQRSKSKLYPYGYIKKSSYLKLIQELKDNIAFNHIITKPIKKQSMANKPQNTSQVEPEVKLNCPAKRIESTLSQSLQMMNIARNFASLERYYLQAAKNQTQQATK